MLDLTIYTCAHRYVDAGTVSAMEMFRINAKLNYLWLILTGDALIGRARSICCTKFMQIFQAKKVSSSPYMLFLDDDILFKPEDVHRIYRDLKQGYDLVGGAYPVKDGTELASTGYGETVPFDGSIIPCRYVATGFMGISVRLIEKLVNELKLPILHKGIWCESYPFFENYGKTDTPFGAIWLSEDYEFCEKALKVGVQPMLDTGVQLAHVGQRVYKFQDVVENHARKRAAAANTKPIEDKGNGKLSPADIAAVIESVKDAQPK